VEIPMMNIGIEAKSAVALRSLAMPQNTTPAVA